MISVIDILEKSWGSVSAKLLCPYVESILTFFLMSLEFCWDLTWTPWRATTILGPKPFYDTEGHNFRHAVWKLWVLFFLLKVEPRKSHYSKTLQTKLCYRDHNMAKKPGKTALFPIFSVFNTALWCIFVDFLSISLVTKWVKII